jgi:hypothetical protein
MAPGCEQDLEYLLRPDAPEVARTDHVSAGLDRERTEESDYRPV